MSNCKYYYNGQDYTKEELLVLIKEGKVAEEQRVEINYTLYDESPLRTLMGLRQEETLLSHLETYYPEQLKKVREYNPNVNFTFDENKTNSFDPITNTVNISLSEVFHMSNFYNSLNVDEINYKDVLNYYIEHELGHAITLPGSKDPEFSKILNSALERARALFKVNPFVDLHRAGYLNKEGYPYALSSVEEFLAEHQSNPDFKNWLSSISRGKLS